MDPVWKTSLVCFGVVCSLGTCRWQHSPLVSVDFFLDQALWDYDARCSDELSFKEGCVGVFGIVFGIVCMH